MSSLFFPNTSVYTHIYIYIHNKSIAGPSAWRWRERERKQKYSVPSDNHDDHTSRKPRSVEDRMGKLEVSWLCGDPAYLLNWDFIHFYLAFLLGVSVRQAQIARLLITQPGVTGQLGKYYVPTVTNSWQRIPCTEVMYQLSKHVKINMESFIKVVIRLSFSSCLDEALTIHCISPSASSASSASSVWRLFCFARGWIVWLGPLSRGGRPVWRRRRLAAWKPWHGICLFD